ncbi:MAG: hypothetical protein IJQ80_03570 [Clostridia bacterium]|nr:hypothetical protein [Clostridia bacterium]
MNENKMTEIIEASVASLKSIAGADTIIGAPIETAPGTTIIPVSKLTIGYVSGGIDYASKVEKAGKNFGGGGGTGISMTPVCFIVIDKEGAVEILNVGADKTPDPIGDVVDLVERSPEIIEKLKGVFKKNKKEKASEDEDI